MGEPQRKRGWRWSAWAACLVAANLLLVFGAIENWLFLGAAVPLAVGLIYLGARIRIPN